MKETQQNNNDIGNGKYNFDALKQYLNTYASVFAGPEKETIEGVEIKNYSNEAKKVWSKMQDVQSKVQKITEKKEKELKEVRKEMIKAGQEALRAYRKQNPLGTEGMQHVKEKTQKYLEKMNRIQQEINNATTKVKREFMDWEQKNIKGNIIARNNNIMTLAKESKAMLGYDELDITQASALNNVKLEGNDQQSLSGNLADIATSMIQLLTDKANATGNKEEKNKLKEYVNMIIQAVQNFFGFSANNGKTIQAHKQEVEALLKQAVKECLNGNLKEIEKSIKNDKSIVQDKTTKDKIKENDINESRTNASTTISSINNSNNKKGNNISYSQTNSINNSSLQASSINVSKLKDEKDSNISNNTQNKSHDNKIKTALKNAKKYNATNLTSQAINDFSYKMGSNNNLSHSTNFSKVDNSEKNNNQNVVTLEDNINNANNIGQGTMHNLKDSDSLFFDEEETILNFEDDGPEIEDINNNANMKIDIDISSQNSSIKPQTINSGIKKKNNIQLGDS